MPRTKATSKHHRAEESALRAFGALIVRKRIMRGLSSEELADLMGISQSSLSRIENGSREPRFEIVRRLNKHLDIAESVLEYLKGGKFNG
jgi:transcriptional regulator with XRE-family HTH domain